MAVEELQAQADQILRGEESEERKGAKLASLEGGRSRFSPFIPSELDRALDLADRLMAIADAQPGDAGVAAALDEAARAAETEDLRLVQHAVELLIIHHPAASRLAIPPIPPPPARRRPAVTLAEAEEDPEAPLDWFREDLLANDHHRHWHVVYPTQGRPAANGRRVLQDRQSELFFYMHEQMLARYDADRRALQLDPVRSFADYGEEIPETHGDRPPGRQLVDINRPADELQFSVAGMEAQRDALRGAVASGRFERQGAGPVEVTTELLGATEEPTLAAVWPGFWHHGYGHMLCAYAMSPTGNDPPGDIGDTATAIRDPWFWRWHRHIDDLNYEWQEKQKPHTFSDGPPVTIRSALEGEGMEGSPDIILCFEKDLPGGGVLGSEAEATAWGEQRFGAAAWERRADASDGSQDVLETRMARAPFDPAAPASDEVTYLDHEPFAYFLRLENPARERSEVTARIFLCPAIAATDRRAWIEMDKFELALDPGERRVVHRPGRLASAVRKPASRPPLFIQPPAGSPHEQYCRCGWPYHMLLPRGTAQGMVFRMLVILTDGRSDRVALDEECGSMSFCGARDRYPDRREMGYPFNRPFGSGKVPLEVLDALPNAASRDVTIHFEG